jgi:hypothetical protein
VFGSPCQPDAAKPSSSWGSHSSSSSDSSTCAGVGDSFSAAAAKLSSAAGTSGSSGAADFAAGAAMSFSLGKGAAAQGTPGKGRARKQHTPSKSAQPAATPAAAAAAAGPSFPAWPPPSTAGSTSSANAAAPVFTAGSFGSAQQQQQQQPSAVTPGRRKVLAKGVPQQQQQFAPAAGFAAPSFSMGAFAAPSQAGAAGATQSRSPLRTHKTRQQQQQQQQKQQQQQARPQAPPPPCAAEVAMRAAEQWVERAKVSWESRRFEQSEREFTQVRELDCRQMVGGVEAHEKSSLSQQRCLAGTQAGAVWPCWSSCRICHPLLLWQCRHCVQIGSIMHPPILLLTTQLCPAADSSVPCCFPAAGHRWPGSARA